LRDAGFSNVAVRPVALVRRMASAEAVADWVDKHPNLTHLLD